MSLRRYVPSGRAGAGAIVAVLVASVAAGVLVGVIEGVVSRWIALFLVFPLMIGLAAGGAATVMVARFKLRAPAIALVLGFLGGAAGYAADHVTSYVQLRIAFADAVRHENAAATDAEVVTAWNAWLTQEVGDPGFRGYLELAAREGVKLKRTSAADPGLTIKGIGAWILWSLELLCSAIVGGAMAWRRAREPFCETCDAWYGKPATVAAGGFGDKAAGRRMTQALEIGDVDGAAAAFYSPAASRRSPATFELTSARCDRCGVDAYCRLNRVVMRKRAQRTKLADWLMPQAEVSRLGDALGRAQGRMQQAR